MKIEFCPSLQLDWILESVSFECLSLIKIKLHQFSGEERPSTDGRHIKDIMSYPNILEVINPTMFYFSNNLYFNIRDDSGPGYSENDEGEGRTYQRLLSSELLTLHTDRAVHGELKHYRIFTQNEIIDIITTEAPEIIKS